MPTRGQSLWRSAKKRLSKMKRKTALLGLVHCAIQGAVVSLLCGLETLVAQSFIGQLVIPSCISFIGQLGATVAAWLPGFLQFIPNMISMSFGWPLLLNIGLGIFMVWKKLKETNPEYANIFLFVMLATVLPVAGFALGWLGVTSAFTCAFFLGAYNNFLLPTFWKKPSYLSSLMQQARALWAAYGKTIISYAKAIPSARVFSASTVGLIHSFIQGAIAVGVCWWSKVIFASFVGKIILPGTLKAIANMGAVAMGALGNVLPSFLQFIPEMIAWSWGWPLLLVPVGFIAYEIYQKGFQKSLPENWETITYLTLSFAVPGALFAFAGISLSSVFICGAALGSFWNFFKPLTMAVVTQHRDNENNQPIELPSKRRRRRDPNVPHHRPRSSQDAGQAPTYHRKPNHIRNPGVPITPAFNQRKTKAKTRTQAAQQNIPVKKPQPARRKSKSSH